MEKEISVEEVRHMAWLSRLAINAEEELLFARQFQKILGHMEVLNNVDTSDVEPLYSPLDIPSATRQDNADNLRSRCEILANAPETDGEAFIVPRIV